MKLKVYQRLEMNIFINENIMGKLQDIDLDNGSKYVIWQTKCTTQ